MRRPVVLALALLLTGCSGTAAPRTQPTPAPTGTPTAPSATPTPSPPPVASGPAGGPVPAGFRAASVTFVSPSLGWLLGSAPCAQAPCTSLLRTRDGGRTWRGIPAPRARLVGADGMAPAGSVTSLRFGDALDGYAFGPGLVVTHDGGATWHAEPGPGGAGVAGLAMARRTAYLLSAGGALYSRPVSGGAWQRLATQGPVGGPLVVQGSRLYVTGGGHGLEVSVDGGRTWARRPDPCARTRQGLQLDDVTLSPEGTAYALCGGDGAAGQSDKAVAVSRDDARTWTLHELGFGPGDGGSLAAPGGTGVVLATASASSWLLRSADGGRGFASVGSPQDSGGEPWSDLGFTTPAQGVVVLGRFSFGADQDPMPEDGVLFLTRDAGRSWAPVRFA